MHHCRNRILNSTYHILHDVLSFTYTFSHRTRCTTHNNTLQLTSHNNTLSSPTTPQTLLSYANNTPLPLTAPSFTENPNKRHIRTSLVHNPGYSSMSLRTIGGKGLDAIEEAAHFIVNEMGNDSPSTRPHRKSLLKSEQASYTSSVLVNTNLAAALSTTPSRKRSFAEMTVDSNKSNLLGLTGEGREDYHDTNSLAVQPPVADSFNSIGSSDSSIECSSPLPSRKKSFASHYPEGPSQLHRLSRPTVVDAATLTVEELQDEVSR